MVKLDSFSVKRGNFVLGPLSLSIDDGVTGVIGPNGSGKSTLLKSLCGLFTDTSGSIKFKNETFASLSPKQRAALFSYIPQELPQAAGFSLYNFVAMGSYRYNRKYYATEKERIEEALINVDLYKKRELQFDALSGGEKQRASLARALVQDSQWILMDEPAAFLDYRHNYLMGDMIRKLIEEAGKSFLIVSHDCDFLVNIAEQFIALKEGSLFAHTQKKSVLDVNFLNTLFDAPFSVDRLNGRIFASYNQ